MVLLSEILYYVRACTLCIARLLFIFIFILVFVAPVFSPQLRRLHIINARDCIIFILRKLITYSESPISLLITLESSAGV